MKLWNELHSKYLPVYGLASVILVILELITGTFGENFARSLLDSFIFVTAFIFLNTKIMPRYISMNHERIIPYIVYLVETIIFVSARNIIHGLIRHGSINFVSLFKSLVFIIIYMFIFCSIVYFLTKAYTKRMNKKLQEYKEQDKPDGDNS